MQFLSSLKKYLSVSGCFVYGEQDARVDIKPNIYWSCLRGIEKLQKGRWPLILHIGCVFSWILLIIFAVMQNVNPYTHVGLHCLASSLFFLYIAFRGNTRRWISALSSNKEFHCSCFTFCFSIPKIRSICKWHRFSKCCCLSQRFLCTSLAKWLWGLHLHFTLTNKTLLVKFQPSDLSDGAVLCC